MDNFISILRDANSPEELEALKLQLFRENVRIKTDKADLEDLKDEISREKLELDELKSQLEKSRKQFDKEVSEINSTIESNRKKLENDIIFLNKKQMVLENGFKQLDVDRQRLNNEKSEFRKLKESQVNIRRNIPVLEYRQGIFFKGITNEKALKKRYKDLIKVFHPDNISGDTDTLQNINREYETLLHDLNMNK
ncbi:MAG: hypothetical protein MJ126_00790 [Lachnospiraceae bacterium]|nr:hypothetical protein [Lachnospiraceae bacterium]